MRLPRPLLAMVPALAVIALVACSSRFETVETPTATAPDEPAASATEAGTSTPPPTAGEDATRPARGTVQPLPDELREILDDIAGVRELEAPESLEAHVIPRSKLPDLLDSLTTDEDRKAFAELTTLYRLLGHLRNDQDFLTVYESFGADAILGLYSPSRDTLWVVVEDGEEESFAGLSRAALETLVHELVHALQDYHFDLDGTYEEVAGNLDREQAWTAVVEGDATTHEGVYSQRFLLRVGAGRAFLLGALPQAGDVPISIVRELLFPYTTGASWIRDIRASEGVEAIDDLIANPPSATSVILHPELRTNGWEPEDVTLPDLAQALGSGWERESGGTLGEFYLGNYLRLEISAGDAIDASAGWAGDAYDVYVNGDESVALFRMRFADTGEANEFAEAYLDFMDDAGEIDEDGEVTVAELPDGDAIALAEPVGSEVAFAIGSSEAIAREALEALLGG